MIRSNLQKIKRTCGLSSLEIVSLVVIIGLFALTSWQWFSNYRLKSRSAEAVVNLKLIFQAEVTYYNQNNKQQFLPLSAQPLSPSSTPQIGNFSSGDWSLLNISINKPVYYSYSVETEGFGDNASFTAIARGDLNADQHLSRWEMIGSINPNGEPVGANIVYSLDPLE